MARKIVPKPKIDPISRQRIERGKTAKAEWLVLAAKKNWSENDRENFKRLQAEINLGLAAEAGTSSTLVMEEQAANSMWDAAKQAGLSDLEVLVAMQAAGAKVRGESAESITYEVCGNGSTFNDEAAFELAVKEVKEAGLWPWKGAN